MTRRTSAIKRAAKTPETDVRYCHILQVLTDWIGTTVMVVIGGRGLAKSTVIQALRSYRCVYDMPGAAFAFVSNTYVNLQDNIMPAVQKGWGLLGWAEGRDYIKYKRPPESWRRRCSVIVDDYRNAISFPNGCVIFLGSLDNPSLLAGKSVVHLFMDEAKYDKEQKVNRAFPILRGDALAYGNSVLFLGITITTDMPDITEGEFDWFFRYADEMDADRIYNIARVACALNEELLEMESIKRRANSSQLRIRRQQERIDRLQAGLWKMRKGQTFFFNASSLVNVQILTVEYIRRLLSGTLEMHEAMKSVFGMRPGLKRELRFYTLWSETHKYYDGTADGVAATNSSQLRYLHQHRPIEAGMDFGNQTSLVIGQYDNPSLYRIHKSMYVLAPQSIRQLADQFLLFFAGHGNKVLDFYYDRAGNNYAKQKKDQASEFKDAVEKDADGHRTGWIVNLKSRKQGIIRQNAEYTFMITLLGGTCPALPALQVDALNCREMISSIELAKAEVTYQGDSKIVRKVKKTEKLDLKKLPMLSTNFSDAFKYLLMRKDWLSVAHRTVSTSGSSSSGAVDQWFDSLTSQSDPSSGL